MSKARIKKKHRSIPVFFYKGHEPKSAVALLTTALGVIDYRQTRMYNKRWMSDPFYHISIGMCPAPIKGAKCKCCNVKCPPTFWYGKEF